MFSPQLDPDSSTSCPPAPLDGALNVSIDPSTPPTEETRLAVVMGADMKIRNTTDAVVNGLWHCLLGSLVAGLGVSTVLGVLVLILSQIG